MEIEKTKSGPKGFEGHLNGDAQPSSSQAHPATPSRSVRTLYSPPQSLDCAQGYNSQTLQTFLLLNRRLWDQRIPTSSPDHNRKTCSILPDLFQVRVIIQCS